MWANGSRDETLTFLRHFSESLKRDLEVETQESTHRSGVSKTKLEEVSRLLARCYFKQAKWGAETKTNWNDVSPLL